MGVHVCLCARLTVQVPEKMSDGCVWEAAREPNPASSAHADASTDYLIPSGTPNTDSTGRNGHEVVEVYAGEQQGEGAAQGAGASGLPPGLALNGFDPVLLGSQVGVWPCPTVCVQVTLTYMQRHAPCDLLAPWL